jgi:hypothetical protein
MSTIKGKDDAVRGKPSPARAVGRVSTGQPAAEGAGNESAKGSGAAGSDSRPRDVDSFEGGASEAEQILAKYGLLRPSTLQQLKTRDGIEKEPGVVDVYHSQEASDEDIKLTQRLVTDAERYFARTLGVPLKMDVAILSKGDWEGLPFNEQVEPGVFAAMPYGLPGLADRSPSGGIAMLGTSVPRDVDGDGKDDNVLTAGNLELLSRLPAERKEAILKAGFKSIDEAARKMPLLVALHEVGHVYASKLGMDFEHHGSHTIDEVAATFFLNDFLSSDPSLKKYQTLWNEVLDAYVSTQSPQSLKHSSMQAFDDLYLGVGDPSTGGSMENFLYYQGKFHSLAKQVHEKYGQSFVPFLQEKVRQQTNGGSPQEFYKLLANSDPLFGSWYGSF